jgi:hypothetical protein
MAVATVFSAGDKAFADWKAVKNAASAIYLALPQRLSVRAGTVSALAAGIKRSSQNIVGVGVGERVTAGKHTGETAIKFFVKHKYPRAMLSSAATIPTTLDGLPVDVEESGAFVKIAKKKKTSASSSGMPNPQSRMRPAHPGCSVGFLSSQFRMAGTFGAVVKRARDTFILSNNHVLADENRLSIGSTIVQPGPLDGGTSPADDIAKLTQFVPLDAVNPNKVDAAIAKVDRLADVSRDVLYIGAPTGSQPAAIDMIVHKFGRTTSYTVGRVASIATDVNVGYDIGTLFFEDQIIIVGLSGAFSAAGDSGSLILERGSNRAVGLLFAGSATHTIANHIEDVLQSLGITLA